MTMPVTNVTPMRTVELPAPQFPMLTRMISSPLFIEKEEAITWVVGQSHPLVPDMKVIRMFVGRGGVEVYSVSADGRNGTRNLVPMTMVRFIEEAMPLDVFVEELAAAESDADDEDEEPEEPEPEISPPPVGQ